MAISIERQRQVRSLLGLDVPVRYKVLQRFNALPVPGANQGALIAPFDADVLQVFFLNAGTGSVYLRDGDQPNVTTETAFEIGPGVAFVPEFPFHNAVWAAGAAGHDLRVSMLVVDWSLRRER